MQQCMQLPGTEGDAVYMPVLTVLVPHGLGRKRRLCCTGHRLDSSVAGTGLASCILLVFFEPTPLGALPCEDTASSEAPQAHTHTVAPVYPEVSKEETDAAKWTKFCPCAGPVVCVLNALQSVWAACHIESDVQCGWARPGSVVWRWACRHQSDSYRTAYGYLAMCLLMCTTVRCALQEEKKT
jgi:hypothetical protein